MDINETLGSALLAMLIAYNAGLKLTLFTTNDEEDVSDRTPLSTCQTFMSVLSSLIPIPDMVAKPKKKTVRFSSTLESGIMIPQTDLQHNRANKPWAPRATTSKVRQEPEPYPRGIESTNYRISKDRFVTLVWSKSATAATTTDKSFCWAGALIGLATETLNMIAEDLDDFSDPVFSTERTKLVFTSVNLGYRLYLLALETKAFKHRVVNVINRHFGDLQRAHEAYAGYLTQKRDGNTTGALVARISRTRFQLNTCRDELEERLRRLRAQATGMIDLANTMSYNEIPAIIKDAAANSRASDAAATSKFCQLIIDVLGQVQKGLVAVRVDITDDLQFFCGDNAEMAFAELKADSTPGDINWTINVLKDQNPKAGERVGRYRRWHSQIGDLQLAEKMRGNAA
ncbi:hypothetical protein OQA88_9700 [Cercophora sp. LCS_1]